MIIVLPYFKMNVVACSDWYNIVLQLLYDTGIVKNGENEMCNHIAYTIKVMLIVQFN